MSSTGDDLRHLYAEALMSTIKQSTIIVHSSIAAMVGRQPGDVTEYDLADAVMAVRDDEMERLRLIARANHGLHRSADEEAVQASAAIARARHVCHQAMAEEDAPGMWLVAQRVLAALDDPPEETS